MGFSSLKPHRYCWIATAVMLYSLMNFSKIVYFLFQLAFLLFEAKAEPTIYQGDQTKRVYFFFYLPNKKLSSSATSFVSSLICSALIWFSMRGAQKRIPFLPQGNFTSLLKITNEVSWSPLDPSLGTRWLRSVQHTSIKNVWGYYSYNGLLSNVAL